MEVHGLPGAGPASAGLFDVAEERFNLLCLAEDEYYFRDHSASMSEDGGRPPVAGHLKVCSLCLFFVPRDVHDPIVRIPFTATTDIEECAGAAGSLDWRCVCACGVQRAAASPALRTAAALQGGRRGCRRGRGG